MTSPPVPVRILLVEDSVAQARFIQHTLRDPSSLLPFQVAWVESLADTLRHLAATPVDLVLLDLVLPDSDGSDTFGTLHRSWPDVPVIVLSGAGDQTTAIRAVAEGAQDYLPKGTMSPDLLTRSIRYALERNRSLLELQRAALIDDLSGLPNRRAFLALAEKQLVAARRTCSPITVLDVDVDGMRRVNHRFGHQAGDRALVDVAAVMRSTFRARDVIGRIGGDEFCALLLEDGGEPGAWQTAASRLDAAIDAHNAETVRPFALSCTVGGVTRTPFDGLTIDDLVSEAERQMHLKRHPSPTSVGPPVADDACRPERKVTKTS